MNKKLLAMGIANLNKKKKIKIKMPKIKTKKKYPELKEPELSDLLVALIVDLDRALLVGMVREFKFHPTRKWRFDLCFPEYMVAVECDGGQRSNSAGGKHNTPEDYEKINAAVELGWRVLRYQGGIINANPHKIIEQIKETKKWKQKNMVIQQ